MLTKVTVYSQWANVDPLVLNVINRPETDLLEVRNIEGLGSVKADVNTTPLGSVDGESFIGSNVGKRNLVFTIGLTPDWDVWTVSRLRRLLDKYWLPKLQTRMVFETMEFSPVEISGYVESNDPNMFSKDSEHQISIICPDLYFKSVDPVIVNRSTDQDPFVVDYEGNVQTGINLEVIKASGADPNVVTISVEDSETISMVVDPTTGAALSSTKKLVVNSIPGEKYVRNVEIPSEIITNLLNFTIIDPKWPTIGPGTTEIYVTSDDGIQDWVLTYYNLFGSL